MASFDPQAEGLALFATADRWEAEGVQPRDVFHAYAQAFGQAMTRYLAPDLAVAFMEQELGRVRAVALSAASQTEARQ